MPISDIPDRELNRFIQQAVRHDTLVAPRQKHRAWQRLHQRIAQQGFERIPSSGSKPRRLAWRVIATFLASAGNSLPRLLSLLLVEEGSYQRARRRRCATDYQNFTNVFLGQPQTILMVQ